MYVNHFSFFFFFFQVLTTNTTIFSFRLLKDTKLENNYVFFNVLCLLTSLAEIKQH